MPPVEAVAAVPCNLDLMVAAVVEAVGLPVVPVMAALALFHKGMTEEVPLVTHALAVAVVQVLLVRQAQHRVMAVQEPQTVLLALQ